jgi:hypothetical protein
VEAAVAAVAAESKAIKNPASRLLSQRRVAVPSSNDFNRVFPFNINPLRNMLISNGEILFSYKDHRVERVCSLFYACK